jgi:hypothetical protein
MLNQFTWTLSRPKAASDTDHAECDGWVRDIQRIFKDGFGLPSDWRSESIRRKLGHCSLFGFLSEKEKPNATALGYAVYSIPNEPFRGRCILWEEAICIVKDARIRGMGLSFAALRNAMACFPELDFGFVGGRTQNPVIFKRYASLGKLFPFDFGYSSEEGRDIMRFLKSHIPDTDSAEETTGISRKQYREGKLGDYRVHIEGGERFESWLEERQFDRDNGDAIILVAELGKS